MVPIVVLRRKDELARRVFIANETSTDVRVPDRPSCKPTNNDDYDKRYGTRKVDDWWQKNRNVLQRKQ
jgi:hypothetical protein